MDIAFILTNPIAPKAPHKENPTLELRVVTYNLYRILCMLDIFPVAPVVPIQQPHSHNNNPDGPLTSEDAGILNMDPKDENRCADECGLFNSMQLKTLRDDPIVQKIEHFLDLVAFKLINTNGCISKMPHFEDRLKTFDILLKNTIHQDTHTLCEAGFIYKGTGEDDKMVCFCCSIILHKWTPNEDPWEEHANWAPHCTYLLLMKGREFVEACSQKKRNPDLQEEPVINAVGDDSITNENLPEERNTNNFGMIDSQHERSGITDALHTNSRVTGVKIEISEIVDGQCQLPRMIDGLHELSVETNGQHELSVETNGQHECPGINDSQKEHSDAIDIQLEYSRVADVCGTGHHFPALISTISEEQNTECNATLCKICFKKKLETVSIPCGHVVACVVCSVTLRDCNECSLSVDRIMRVYPYFSGKNVKYPNQLECPQQNEEPVDSILCKFCHKDDMTIAFLPCRHICACFACGAIMEKCPLCDEPFFAILQVFL